MTPLLRLLAIWGLVDSAWLLADPPGWERFWGQFIASLGNRPLAARALGAVDLLICLSLLLAIRRRTELATVATARSAEPDRPASSAVVRLREVARPARLWHRGLARSA
jgi:hypothetical protein